jgi:hypothetical protein
MNIKILILFILLLSKSMTFAQKYRDIFVHLDTSSFGNSVKFYSEITLIKKRGKQLIIKKSSPNSDWKKLKVITSSNITFDRGICSYFAYNINKSNNDAFIEVSDKDDRVVKRIEFKLPYVIGVEIENKTITVNRLEEINYSLKLNNGRKIAQNYELFDVSRIGFTSSEAIEIRNHRILLNANKPLDNEMVEITYFNKVSGEEYGKKSLITSYPSSPNLYFSGSDGSNGFNGADNLTVSGDGFDGQSGTNGTSALDVNIFVSEVKKNNKQYLVVNCFASDGQTYNEILESYFGKIYVFAKGGNGGSGGNGGNGGDGKIDTTAKIDSPHAGDGGNAGQGGNAGKGGKIHVYFDESAYSYLENFDANINNGSFGLAGNPGKSGKGDYSNSKLLGILFSTKGGKDGQPAANGLPAENGVFERIKLNKTDFEKLLLEKTKN